VTVYTVVTYKTELAGKKRKEPGSAGRQAGRDAGRQGRRQAGMQAGKHIVFL
jgi:hypothetical protein